jgi:putative transposase
MTMTPVIKDTQAALDRQAAHATFRAFVQEQVRLAIRATFIDILEAEVTQFIGAERYERTTERRDQRAGYRSRTLGTTAGVIDDLPVPRTRGAFHTQLFDHYQRRMTEVDTLMRDMFVGGVSQQSVGTLVEQLTGTPASPSTVSRVFHTLEAEFAEWQTRKLPSRYVYVKAFGTYFSVIYDGEGVKMPILALIGITVEGQREVIAFTSGERENQGAWKDLLSDIKERGVQTVDLWITDGHQAMLNAIALKFPASKRQRCVKHKMDNILSHVPESQREGVRQELRAIFYQANRTKADQVAAAFREKYQAIYPSAIACMDRDWEACLTFYAYPEAHWPNIRTSNIIERMFEEVKKRSKKMAAAFRNEGSCLLLFYAVVRTLKFRKIRMPG